MPSPTIPNLPTPLAPVAATINHLLAQEPWARAALRLHAGKVACIAAAPVELRLGVTADGMVEAAPADAAANVTIRLKLSDLPLIAQNRERAFSYVQIEGDAEFANAISQLSKSLRWEAEHDLEKLVGPLAATRLAGGARAAFEALKSGQRKLAENAAEYFLEENPLLVRPAVTEQFGAEVRRLRDDTERFAKRLANLEKKLAQGAGDHT
ncbi:sterol-binding protein [Massilia sp. Root351]|uniref:ubiquinone biosynthesis accessory factor UbiJ n=1 Tax=Massilia sp. Root351 TaxID=1736522 RepID=UPI00070F862C|nr:SCP2 sterol-binding domain-containing protein [Massilia sp. Root351]KQV79467.1 sterol-binding protein [Massilia sp. Root351]